MSAELPTEPDRADFGSEAEYLAAHARYVELRELILSHMLHHDCEGDSTASCMEDGVCRFHYPKHFVPETTYDEQQIYPEYRRRAPDAGGAQIEMNDGRWVDNRWVVPHSPYLLLKYQCHLNVEVCFSVESVKYLYKV